MLCPPPTKISLPTPEIVLMDGKASCLEESWNITFLLSSSVLAQVTNTYKESWKKPLEDIIGINNVNDLLSGLLDID